MKHKIRGHDTGEVACSFGPKRNANGFRECLVLLQDPELRELTILYQLQTFYIAGVGNVYRCFSESGIIVLGARSGVGCGSEWV